MSDDIGTALLLAIGVGGAALFASKMETDKKIKEASNQVSNLEKKQQQGALHQHNDRYPQTASFNNLSNNVSKASNRIESISKEAGQKVVPAYHVGRDRVFLPAQVMPGESPKYEVYTTENYYKGQDGYRSDWVTMVDLTKALQALNAKVEAYKSEGHRHESMEEYMQNGDGVTNHVHLRRAEDEDGRWTGRWDWSPYYLTRWQLPGMESGAL